MKCSKCLTESNALYDTVIHDLTDPTKGLIVVQTDSDLGLCWDCAQNKRIDNSSNHTQDLSDTPNIPSGYGNLFG